MILVWLNRLWFKIFGKKKDQLLFAFQTTLDRSYEVKHTWVYTTFKRAVKEMRKTTSCSVFIQSKYNGLHYPVIDVDSDLELTRVLKEINELRNIPYVVFQSSPGHYWVIIDMGFDKFSPAFFLLKILGRHGILGDRNYYNYCEDQNVFFIRGDYNNNIERLPKIITNLPSTPVMLTEKTNIPKNTEIGAWRTVYFKDKVPPMNNLAYSDEFSKFINHLQKYYNSDVKLVSELTPNMLYGI
jgi:hypothetical protein